MDVQTNSPEIRQARRDIVELLLDNHPKDCQTCERDGNCELQNLAYSMGVRERLFEGKRKQFPIEDSSHSVVRDPDKCILCGRCVRVCAEIQGVYNLSQHGRGFHTVVGPGPPGRHGRLGLHPVRPVHQRLPHRRVSGKAAAPSEVWEALADPEMHVVVQTAPSIRAAIGEGFGLAPGTPGHRPDGHRPAACWASTPCSTPTSAADLTIVEEAHEFLHAARRQGPLPMITSCSPGWISFMEKFYPALDPARLDLPLADEHDVGAGQDLLCRADGHRPEEDLHGGGDALRGEEVRGRPARSTSCPTARPYTDAVLTTRELIWMIKCYGIDFARLAGRRVRRAAGHGQRRGRIFGTTGGVMEATLRAASELVTGKPADRLEFTEVRAVEGLRETYVAIGDKNIHVGVANGLKNAKVPAGQGAGRGRAVPRDRGHGLPRRVHRRRRAALSARRRQGARSRAAPQAGPSPVFDRQRQGAPQVVRKPGHPGTLRHVPRRARARPRPTNCCTPTTSADLPRGIR